MTTEQRTTIRTYRDLLEETLLHWRGRELIGTMYEDLIGKYTSIHWPKGIYETSKRAWDGHSEASWYHEVKDPAWNPYADRNQNFLPLITKSLEEARSLLEDEAEKTAGRAAVIDRARRLKRLIEEHDSSMIAQAWPMQGTGVIDAYIEVVQQIMPAPATDPLFRETTITPAPDEDFEAHVLKRLRRLDSQVLNLVETYHDEKPRS